MTDEILAYLPSYYSYGLRLIRRDECYFLHLELDKPSEYQECPISDLTAMLLQDDLAAWGGIASPKEIEAHKAANEARRTDKSFLVKYSPTYPIRLPSPKEIEALQEAKEEMKKDDKRYR